jgi:hypothetical protein
MESQINLVIIAKLVSGMPLCNDMVMLPVMQCLEESSLMM